MKHRKPRNKHQKKNQTHQKLAASKAAAAAASAQASAKLAPPPTEPSEDAATAQDCAETTCAAREQPGPSEKGATKAAATRANHISNGHIDSGDSAASTEKVVKTPPSVEAKKSPSTNGSTATTPEGNSQPKTVLGYTDKPSTSAEATASYTRISESFAEAIVSWILEQPRLYEYLCNLQRRIIDKILKNNAEQARQLLLLHNELPPSKQQVRTQQKPHPKVRQREGAASGVRKIGNLKMENDTIVNSTSLEDVALSEMSDNRAQSIQSLHSVPDTPTGEPDEPSLGLDDLQRRLERSNRCIESMQQEQLKLLRLHQDAKSNLAMLEKLRAAKARPLHGATDSEGGVPNYETIVDVGSDMSMLVSRMNNLSEFIKNQNSMSQLLGDDGPDLAAEHDELMAKIAGLQQSRNDMSNLVKELNTLTENAERSAQEAQQRAAAEQESTEDDDEEDGEEDEDDDDDEEASRLTPTPQMPQPVAATANGERVVPIEYSRVVPIQMSGNNNSNNNKNKALSREDQQQAEQQKQVGDIEKTLSAIRAMLADVTRMEHVLDDGVEQRLQPAHESAANRKNHPEAGGPVGEEEALKRRIDIINGIANALTGQSQLYSEECERIQRLKADVGQHMKDAANAVQMGEDAIRRCTPTPTPTAKAGSGSEEREHHQQQQQQQQQDTKDLRREYEARKRQFEAMCRSLNSDADSEAEPKREERASQRKPKAEEQSSPAGKQVHNVLRPEPTRGTGLRERRANYSAQSSKDTSRSTQRSTTSAEASVFDDDDTVTPPYDYEEGGYRRGVTDSEPYSPTKPLNHQATRRSNAAAAPSKAPQSQRSGNGSVKSSDSMPPAMNLITNPYWNARQASHNTRRESSTQRRQTPSGHEAAEAAAGYVPPQPFYGLGEANGTATPLTAAQLTQTDPLMLQQFMHTQNVLLNSVFHFNQTSWHHQHEIDALKRKVKELEDKLNAVASKASASSDLNDSMVAGSYRADSLPPPLSSYAAGQGIYNVSLGGAVMAAAAAGRAQSEQPLNHLVQSQSQAAVAAAATASQQQHASAFAQYDRLYAMPTRLLYGSTAGGGVGVYGDGQPAQGPVAGGGPVAAAAPVVAAGQQAAAGQVPQTPPTAQQFVQLNNAVPPPPQQPPPPPMVETLFNNETTPASPLGGPGPIFMHHHNNSIYQNNANLRSQNHYANNLQHQQQQQQHHHHQQSQHQHLTTNHNSSNNTLNNQVAPGNRTNNYWDNFRSYSRQNLLSTNSNKSNEEQQQQYMQQQQRQQTTGQHTPHAHHIAAAAVAHPGHPATPSLCSGHPQRGHVEEYDPRNPGGGSLIRPQHCPPPVYRPKPQTPHGAISSLHNDWNNNNAAAATTSTASGNKPSRPPQCGEPPFDMFYAAAAAAAAAAGWNCTGSAASGASSSSPFTADGLPAAASICRLQDYKNVNIGNRPHYQRNKVPAKASCHPAPERRRYLAEFETAATWPNQPAGEPTRGRNYHRVSNLSQRRKLPEDEDEPGPPSDAEPEAAGLFADLGIRRRDSSSNSSGDTSAHRPDCYNSYDTPASSSTLPNEGLRRSLLPRPTTSNSLRVPLGARAREPPYPKGGSGGHKLYNSMNNVRRGGEPEVEEQEVAGTLTLRHNNVLKPRDGPGDEASNVSRDSELLAVRLLNSQRLKDKEAKEEEEKESLGEQDSFQLPKAVERLPEEKNIALARDEEEEEEEEKASSSWHPDPVDILIGRIVHKLFSTQMAGYPVNDEFLREVSRSTVLSYHTYTARAHIAYEPRLTEQTLYERLKAMKYPEQREAFDLWYHELLAELFRHKASRGMEGAEGAAASLNGSLGHTPARVEAKPNDSPPLLEGMLADPPRELQADSKEEVTPPGPQSAQESPSRSASGAKPREPNGRPSGSAKKSKRSNNKR